MKKDRVVPVVCGMLMLAASLSAADSKSAAKTVKRRTSPPPQIVLLLPRLRIQLRRCPAYQRRPVTAVQPRSRKRQRNSRSRELRENANRGRLGSL